MPRRAVAGLLALALAGAAFAAAADEPEAPEEQEKKDEVPVAKFSHADHAALKDAEIAIEENCGACHGDDPEGELSKPGKPGHQPCLDSGCHADDFLAIGKSTREEAPERWRQAASFCRGCHESVPQNFDRAEADNVYRVHPSPEYHVELNHFEHTERAACRDCHKVHPDLREPGHTECSSCHGETAPPMSECGTCHQEPGANQYFSETREGSDTRSCNTPAHLELAKRLNQKPEEVPCFEHEAEHHRFWSENKNTKRTWERGESLPCSHCHYMVANKKWWKVLGSDYVSLKDITAAPVMDNRRDEAHERCGAVTACHGREVDDSFGTGKCTKCHDEKIVDSLFQ